MRKMNRFIIFVLFFPVVSCVTYDYGLLEYKDTTGTLEAVVRENVVYDPYADKLYINTPELITRAYKDHLERILNADEKRMHFWGLAEVQKADFKWKTVNYASFPYWEYCKGESFGKAIKTDAEKAAHVDLLDAEIKQLLSTGWLVKKVGPTQTSTSFVGYKVPLKLYWIMYKYRSQSEIAKNMGGTMFTCDGIDILLSQVQEKPKPATQDVPAVTESKDIKQKLTELKALFDSGLITEGEYNKKRQEILDSMK